MKHAPHYILIPILPLLFICIGVSSVFASNPKSYVCNTHVKYQVKKNQYNYLIEYSFKDYKNIVQTFKFYYPIKLVQKDISRFGVPASLLKTGKHTKSEVRYYLKKGMFKMESNVVRPDKRAVFRFYRPYCKPIADEIGKTLLRYKEYNRRKMIEFTMKFVQDIPYGIPDSLNYGKLNNGFMTPPEILIKGWGDCDSKAVLFTCILSYLINPKDILILNQTSHHTLTAIKSKPEKGQTYIIFENSSYVLAETAGPGRFMFGDDGNKFASKKGYKIEKIAL